MFTSTIFAVFLFSVALTQGQMDDDPECRPPPPPNKEGSCCTVPRLLDNADKPEVIKKCHDEAGMKRPSGPPGSGTPPTAEEMAAHKSAHECADECIFKSSNLLKSDGELDQDAIKATTTKMFTGDWSTIASTAVEKCLATAKSEVGASAKCKSGAHQMVKCFARTMFLNCPASSWTESTECAAAKTRLTKCPNAMPPPPHHSRH
ncbi:hypothetical protein GE061_019394 [Apolygus lucorum]|uniref:Odorant-binding protein 25 n=1 Tax=Apolygus lucorum TaxID=248454 RepID=A0A142FH92_APOLU|nr:odorant-binding protein 25 [Apolygus lucorum]KAF6205227.1 hypothetical protein GE061_019394 [Apolygus lucorum]